MIGATMDGWVEQCHIDSTSRGILDGLSFAVKDLIALQGYKTGGGNPDWQAMQPKAATHAVCVEQLLQGGAHCLGKTLTDELAFSLIGENHFYGTPINTKAPDRVPGGSSSGSASVVASQQVDFALGTDTGGSCRVPASNCGIYGYRPTWGCISLAGIMPFAPSFDTVGVLASTFDVMEKAVLHLLAEKNIPQSTCRYKFVWLEDVANWSSELVLTGLKSSYSQLHGICGLRKTTLNELFGQPITYQMLFDTYVTIQCSEIWSSLGGWIEDKKPRFGPMIDVNFRTLAKTMDRSQIQSALEWSVWFKKRLTSCLQDNTIVCFPTMPFIAPKKNSMRAENRKDSLYYPKTLAVNAISGLSGAPQVTLPLGNVQGVPIGLSFLASPGNDALLLQAVGAFDENFNHKI